MEERDVVEDVVGFWCDGQRCGEGRGCWGGGRAVVASGESVVRFRCIVPSISVRWLRG